MNPDENTAVTFRAALMVWLKIGFVNFGGPAGQIALMHKMLVVERKWLSESRFLHALNYCMLLPGPEAQQLAVYIGWLMHKTWGGLVAGVLFVLPGFLLILAISMVAVFNLGACFCRHFCLRYPFSAGHYRCRADRAYLRKICAEFADCGGR